MNSEVDDSRRPPPISPDYYKPVYEYTSHVMTKSDLSDESIDTEKLLVENCRKMEKVLLDEYNKCREIIDDKTKDFGEREKNILLMSQIKLEYLNIYLNYHNVIGVIYYVNH